MREDFFLEMLRRRLESDESTMLAFNRSVIHDMLAVFGRQRSRYLECKDALKQYACDCTVHCGREHWGEDYCGYKAQHLSGEKDDGSDEVQV